MPYISGGSVSPSSFAAASVPISKLADPTTGKVIGSAANAAAAVYPPGFEINYTQITSNVNIVSTTEATGTSIIAPGAIVFDGTAVLLTFFAPFVNSDNNALADSVIISLFEGATQITRLSQINTVATGADVVVPICAQYRFTPTAASHTYTVTAFATSTAGTPKVGAGAGGTGAAAPAFVRFTKV